MMPAFSTAISATVSPRYSVWSSPIGVTTATSASSTLVASQVPPMPTSTTATSTGASAKMANANAGDGLEEGQRNVGLLVGQFQERLDLAVAIGKSSIGDRLPVEHDAFGHADQVRAGVAAGAQAEAAQQFVDHPGGGGLAVRPGQMDGAVGPLGLAEQVQQPFHPGPGR